MLSFDPDDLSLGNEFVIDAWSIGLRYSNGRLFGSNMYSDDGGVTWTEISSSVDVRWGDAIDILDNKIVILSKE